MLGPSFQACSCIIFPKKKKTIKTLIVFIVVRFQDGFDYLF
jgi:hypothetical protein